VSGMRFRRTSMDGPLVVETDAIADERGYFVRVLSADDFSQAGIDHAKFVQENQSRSRMRTIRGLHFLAAPGEAKLVRCVHGEIFDVVVDVRPSSPTFGKWEHFILDDKRHLQLYIPVGFAHGFQALSDVADVCYRHDRYYDPKLDAVVAYNDPEIGIDWPLPDPFMSERDRNASALGEIRPKLEVWFG
jgi:dTDP-4-dehydrorhamnose 3,5-epimerase